MTTQEFRSIAKDNTPKQESAKGAYGLRHHSRGQWLWDKKQSKRRPCEVFVGAEAMKRIFSSAT